MSPEVLHKNWKLNMGGKYSLIEDGVFRKPDKMT